MLRAVAVMEVEVDDEDPLEPEGRDEMLGRDGDIVEDAKPAGPGRFGVMAGRAHQRERVIELFLHDHRGGQDCPSGGEHRGLVGFRRRRSIGVEGNPLPARGPADLFEIRPGVDELDLRVGGRPRFDDGVSRERPVFFQHPVDRPQPVGALRMRRPHVMVEIPPVFNDPRGHRQPPYLVDPPPEKFRGQAYKSRGWHGASPCAPGATGTPLPLECANIR